MPARHISLSLPWPPSTNTYWRNVRGRTVLSRAGREYKEKVKTEIHRQLGLPVPTLSGAVALSVCLQPPDRRRRDIDNHAGKALLDALQAAGVLEDDSQVKELHAFMQEPTKKGSAMVEISALES